MILTGGGAWSRQWPRSFGSGLCEPAGPNDRNGSPGVDRDQRRASCRCVLHESEHDHEESLAGTFARAFGSPICPASGRSIRNDECCFIGHSGHQYLKLSTAGVVSSTDDRRFGDLTDDLESRRATVHVPSQTHNVQPVKACTALKGYYSIVSDFRASQWRIGASASLIRASEAHPLQTYTVIYVTDATSVNSYSSSTTETRQA
jgi:hypothetical protein